MNERRTVGPSAEPIDLDEAKDHCRIVSSTDDAYVQRLIIAAREWAEAATGRALITQTWVFRLDCFPAHGEIMIPHSPVQSISSVSYLDTAGATQTLDSADYSVDIYSLPARLRPSYGNCWPSTRQDYNAVTITAVCGEADAADVPEKLKQAMLLVIGHLFEHREEVSDFQVFQVPKASEWLAEPYRIHAF